MKKIFISALLLISSMCIFTACDDDRDSNPTIQEPETFVLNTPAYATSEIDLASSKKINFTCSQPEFGYTAAVTYQIQVSLNNSFTLSANEAEEDEIPDYAVVDETYTSCNIASDASLFSKAVMQVGQWEEDDVPALQSINVRLVANVDKYSVASNTVDMKVIPYYIELSDALPELWYLIGGGIGDGKWTNSADAIGTSIYPMSLVDKYEYDKKTGKGELIFTGYLTTEGFKLIKTPGDALWTDQWGMKDGNLVKNDGGSGNITVPENGYYTIKLDTKSDKLTVEKLESTPTVYESICMSGSFNDWGNTTMTPVNTTESVKANNHIWVYTLDATDGAKEVKFKLAPTADSDGWGTNWGGSAFPYGIGTNGGSNVPVPAGKYIVVFNDIDGCYTFTAVE